MATKCGLDYAVVIVMSVFIFAGVYWVISARKWFHGPVRNVDELHDGGTPDFMEEKES